MANHAHVFTRKHMTPEKVRAVLSTLNDTVFFGVLDIEEQDEGHWWISVSDSPSGRWFWLESRNHLETSHGPGGDFLWWVSSVVQDAISKEFDGRVKDDGGAGCDKVLKSWNTPLTFPEYFWHRHRHITPLHYAMLKFLSYGYSKKYRLALKKHRKVQSAKKTTETK